MAAGRRFGATRRTTTALLAGTIGVLAPLGVALPAWAQSSTPSDGYFATPPLVDDSKLIPDERKPDKAYKPSKACVQRSTLGQNIEIKSRPWGQEYLQISKAQDIVKAATGSAGKGIRVAVIDTGVTRHPWFQDRLESGGEYVAKPSKGQPDGLEDCDGHGTEVAGIIAAKPDNPEVGFVGVAPDATIVSYRQLSENYEPDTQTSSPPAGSTSGTPSSNTSTPPGSDTALPPSNGGGGGSGDGDGTSPGQSGGGRQLEKAGTAGTLKTLAEIIHGIAERHEASVINMSVDNCRTATGSITEGEQQVQAAVHFAASQNIVVIAAAGNATDTCPQNDQQDPQKPRTIVTPPWFADDVLSVGAIEELTGSVAPFSVHGPWVGVAAPGTKIISLDPAEGSTGLANLTFESGDKASEIQGTSFAAPYVAGLAALVRAKYPDLDAKHVVDRIKETAQHPASPGGRDNFVGFGVIDPVAALTQILPSEVGIVASQPGPQLAQLPPANDHSSTPMIVALAGTGGGLVALLITLFVMRTIRRNRPETTSSR